MARSHNPQEQFEELKRKNRNRLIGATAFVTLGAGVLISALNHQQESSNEIVRVDMPGTPTVLSKAPEVQTEILQPALPQVAQETTPAPTETAKNIPETVQAKKLEKPVTPKIEPKTETKKTEKPVVTKTETKKAEKPVVSKTETKKTEKPVVTKTETKKAEKPVATKTETKKTEKPVVTKTETKKAEKPVATKTETKKTDNKKLSPQEILNGKAGKTVTANKTSTIQIGAFSSSQQAETQKAKLAQIGVNAKVHQAQSANGTVYRVRVQAASSAESERIVKRLKDNGFDSISVHQ